MRAPGTMTMVCVQLRFYALPTLQLTMEPYMPLCSGCAECGDRQLEGRSAASARSFSSRHYRPVRTAGDPGAHRRGGPALHDAAMGMCQSPLTPISYLLCVLFWDAGTRVIRTAGM
jgi:hypothetical protein